MRTIQVNALILSTLFFFNSLCFAQAYKVETLSGSVGGEVLFTESKLSATNKTGRGFTLKGEYVFAGHASATISSGYYFMPGKDVLNIQTVPISAIPAKAGVRYYFGSFYGTGEAGAIFFMGNNSRTGFLYSFGLGDKFKLGRNVFDIGLRHEGWSTADNSRGIIGLRVACEFALNLKQNSRMIGL
ncbi:MAG: hypothetical protein SGI96_04295 [Bacteroidota bacterium]|nr:hypothetical protein [Bacteroidota bacterium]